MINQKYYSDIKQFPSQFKTGFNLAKDIKIKGKFDRIVLCGMGGSALYVDMIKNILDSKKISVQFDVNQGYIIPFDSNKKTLFIVASYSGNTEETLSCLEQIKEKGFKYIVLTAGGKLLEHANEKKVPFFQIPEGLQPRLSTGYFISGVLQILTNMEIIDDISEEIIKISEKMDDNIDEDKTQMIAKSLMNKVPIIYSTKENFSIARISKIKFNENSKVQAFWNFFPELNHNEMVGFTNMIMNPYFLIFKSKFTHERNIKRIETFAEIMESKNLEINILNMVGESLTEEIINAYYFVDHITYYLAEEYNIDPEPVAMVEDFKEMLK